MQPRVTIDFDEYMKLQRDQSKMNDAINYIEFNAEFYLEKTETPIDTLELYEEKKVMQIKYSDLKKVFEILLPNKPDVVRIKS